MDMKTMQMVAVAAAMVGGCVAAGGGDATDEAALTGSGSGIGSGSGSGSGSGGGTGSGSGGGNVWHSSQNGGAASLNFYDGNGTSGFLSAYENGTGQSRVANLVFSFGGPDPTSQVCYTWTDPWWGTYTYCYYTAYFTEWGWGAIPPSDFTVGASAESARLHTTTGPSFYTEKCTYTWYPWGWYNCQFGMSETLDVAWNYNGQSSHSQNGTTTNTYGAYSQQTSGRFVSRSATATGTAAGLTITGAFGGIEDSQGSTVSRDIVRATH